VISNIDLNTLAGNTAISVERVRLGKEALIDKVEVSEQVRQGNIELDDQSR
jgi:hypothetical protein